MTDKHEPRTYHKIQNHTTGEWIVAYHVNGKVDSLQVYARVVAAHIDELFSLLVPDAAEPRE